jgi:hypothetical protein
VIELYAITEAPPPPHLPEGLRAIASAGLVAVYATADEQEATPAALWRREELIESLMEDDCDLLPVRFGSRVQDEAAVIRVLDALRESLTGALERVRGAVELSVRVLGEHEDDDHPPAAGGAYIRAKAKRGSIADSIHSQLGGHARATVIHGSGAREELLRAAYLVDRGSVQAFTERIAQIQRERPQLRVLCTGPWPPYSFTGE